MYIFRNCQLAAIEGTVSSFDVPFAALASSTLARGILLETFSWFSLAAFGIAFPAKMSS